MTYLLLTLFAFTTIACTARALFGSWLEAFAVTLTVLFVFGLLMLL